MFTLGLVLVLLGCSPSGPGPQEVLVFAAASLADALEEIGADFESEAGARVVFSFGGSQMLAQQVAGGAPADLIIAAGEPPIAFLMERGEVRSEPVDLLANRLVLAVRRGAIQPRTMLDLASPAFTRIAIADPDLAPAGTYAREALIELGLWGRIEDRLVFGPDVRATLAYVESGSADVALVYETDALGSSRVEVLDIVPPESYSPVAYPAALVKDAPNESGGRRFLEFLAGPQAGDVFRRLGFQTLR